MTRKSTARLARDDKERRLAAAQEQLKENACWDDLEQIRQQCLGMIQKHTYIAGFLRDRELMAHVEDIPLLTERARLLQRDLVSLGEDLEKLYDLHRGKTGGAEDPDVLMHSIHIHEQYSLFMERHEGVVMPTVGAILDQINMAEHRQAVALQAAREALAEEGIDPDAPVAEGVDAAPAADVAYEPTNVVQQPDGSNLINAEPIVHSN